MKFGIFDHIDANGMTIGEQYAQRLRLVELYEKLGFNCYHLTAHHATDLGMASSPSVFLAAATQHTGTIKLGTGTRGISTTAKSAPVTRNGSRPSLPRASCATP